MLRLLIFGATLVAGVASAQTPSRARISGGQSGGFTSDGGTYASTATAPIAVTAGNITCTALSATAGGCVAKGADGLGYSDAGLVVVGSAAKEAFRLGVDSVLWCGNTTNDCTMKRQTTDMLTFGGSGNFVGCMQWLGQASDTGAADTAIVLGNRVTLGAADTMIDVRNGNSFSSALIYQLAVSGVQKVTSTDQSADCDNAATGNAASGKICIQAGQGSMVLTNSAVTTSSLVFLTNVSDDATCLSGYATVGSGTVTIGCVGAGVATANTVMSFHVMSL